MENETNARLKDVEELDQTICLTWKIIESKDPEPCPGCGETHTHSQIQASAYIDTETDSAVEALGHLMQKDKRFAYILKKAVREHQLREQLGDDGGMSLYYLISKLKGL